MHQRWTTLQVRHLHRDLRLVAPPPDALLTSYCSPTHSPFGKNHGAPGDEDSHVGDLGNIEAGVDGVAFGTIHAPRVQLGGEHSVAGRSIMVHADPDDLGKGDNSEPGPPPMNGKCSLVTGNAGARLACGEIRLVSSDEAAGWSRTREVYE